MIYILLFLLVCTNSYAQESFKVRNFEWGATMEQVISSEGSPNEIIKDRLPGFEFFIYENIFVAGHKSNVLRYSFYNKRLDFVDYYFSGINNGANSEIFYSSIFIDIREKLIQLYGDYKTDYAYGETISPKRRGSEIYDLLINNYKKIDASPIGFFGYKTIWDINGTNIELSINYSRSEYLWEIQLMYSSPSYVKNYIEAGKQRRENREGL